MEELHDSIGMEDGDGPLTPRELDFLWEQLETAGPVFRKRVIDALTVTPTEATQEADVELNQAQLDALTQGIAREVRAATRTNTISACVEKLSSLPTLPFDATLYIRRDDAVAALELLIGHNDC
jgi:hypothetical protein